MFARVGKGQQALFFLRLGADFGDKRCHGLAAIQTQFPAHQVGGLNAVGTFVDRCDTGIPEMLACAGFLDEAHTAMNLHAERGDFIADIGAIAFDQRCQDFGAGLGALDAQSRAVDARRCII